MFSAPPVASPRSSPAHRSPKPATALGADGLNPVVYWLVSAALLGGLAAGIVWVWIVLRRYTRKTETDPRRLAGIATSHEVKGRSIREGTA